jgi:hypothetical protein
MRRTGGIYRRVDAGEWAGLETRKTPDRGARPHKPSHSHASYSRFIRSCHADADCIARYGKSTWAKLANNSYSYTFRASRFANRSCRADPDGGRHSDTNGWYHTNANCWHHSDSSSGSHNTYAEANAHDHVKAGANQADRSYRSY